MKIYADVDAVDFKLISLFSRDNICVPQNYGGFAMVLGKESYAFHQAQSGISMII